MTMLTLEPSINPNTIFVTVKADIVSERPIFTIHINLLGDIREDPCTCTSLDSSRVGVRIELPLQIGSEKSMYCCYLCNEPIDEYMIHYPNNNALLFKQYFFIKNGVIELADDAAGEEKRKAQASLNQACIYTDSNNTGDMKFQVVVFCAGAYLDTALLTKGISIIPLNPGISNISIFEATKEYLLNNHNVDIFFNNGYKAMLTYEPAFVIRFNRLISISLASALKYVETQISYISNILAFERGNKPYAFLTMILDLDTHKVTFNPKSSDYRGNLIGSLFPNVNADAIENLYPIIKSNPFARLVLDLYVQIINERDPSYKFFRQWSLLEVVADKYVKKNGSELIDSDGKVIYAYGTTKQTTRNKAGMVYELLRSRGIKQINQGFNEGPDRVIAGSGGGSDLGGGVITLYEAVEAAYNIRNEVAHDGLYDVSKPAKNKKEELSLLFYKGQFGFLEHAVRHIAEPEIFKAQ